MGRLGRPCMESVFCALLWPEPPSLSEVFILWSGKFWDLEDSTTLPMPMLESRLEDEAELWRYLELAEGGAGAGGSGMATPGKYLSA